MTIERAEEMDPAMQVFYVVHVLMMGQAVQRAMAAELKKIWDLNQWHGRWHPEGDSK